MLTKIQEIALSRSLRRWGRKVRSPYFAKGYVWQSLSTGATVTNTAGLDWGWEKLTNREVRRIKGGLPEIKKSLRRTAKACGFKGELVTPKTLRDFGIEF